MRLDDRVVGGVAALGGAAYAFVAFGLPNLAGQPYGAGFFPSIIGVAMTLAGVVLFVRGFKAKRPVPQPADGIGEAADAERPTLGGVFRYVVVLAAIAFYVAAAPYLGFVISSFVIMVVLGLVFRAPVLTTLIVAVVATLVLALLFGHLLRVPLPPGPIGFL
ncbi:tripartite tricarboxylate transporter TctB family protein [Acuticoccus sp. M5D2P5]|uniref:tripartite tricarboxylate transporter TctB family protein n=1 Tax=Acuticoccus kalidii TaxID=2910977 RepID=UPI001F182370|nr:tripartite tricarboxylate transporter TctB family protein [Acuticoccus kalidii]MCF3934603.1 tripartite tricarboxylate transporter TctB family protein [Acuticoccus kalidii]